MNDTNSHGEGFRCKEDLDEAAAEENLHHLLDDWQQAAVVHPNTSFEQLLNSLHLRQLAIRRWKNKQKIK